MRTSFLIPGESFSHGRRRGGSSLPPLQPFCGHPAAPAFPRRLHGGERRGSTWFVNVAVALGRDKRGAAQSCPEPQCSAHTLCCEKAPVEAAARPQGWPCSVPGWLEKHSVGKRAPNLISHPSQSRATAAAAARHWEMRFGDQLCKKQPDHSPTALAIQQHHSLR